MDNGQKQLNGILHVSQKHYQKIVDNIGVGISIVSLNMELLFINKYMQKQFPNIDVSCRPVCYKVYKDPPRDKICSYCPTYKALQDGEIHRAISCTPRGLEIKHYEIISSPLKDDEGNIIAAIEMVTECTQEVKAEEALRVTKERLHLLFENIPDIILQVDKQGRIMFINRAVIPGRPLEKLRDTYVYNYVLKEYYDISRKKMDLAFQRGQCVQWTVRHISGAYYTVRAVPAKENGRVESAVLILTDITEQLKLDRQNILFKNLSDRANIPIGICDSKGILTYVNECMAQLHGYKPEDVIGKPIVIFHKDTQREKFLELAQIVREKGWFQNEEILHLHKSGYEFPMLMSGIKYHPEGEKEPIMAVSGVELTERRRMENELAVYRDQIRRVEQLHQLSALRSTIVHELSQPLSVVRLMVQDCLEEIDQQGNITALKNNLQETLRQINNTADIIHKYTGGQPSFRYGKIEEVNIGEIVIKIKKTIEAMSGPVRLNITVQDMSNLHPVMMDSRDMEQICFILMQNALQAADTSRTHNLMVSNPNNDGQIELFFQDDCGGIDPQNIDRIFEPFYTTKSHGEGTGLGLFIVRQILDKYDGQISVENTPGKGAVFRVILPRLS